MSGGAAVTLALLCGVRVIRTFIIILGALRIKYIIIIIIIDRLRTIRRCIIHIMRLVSSEQIVLYNIILLR